MPSQHPNPPQIIVIQATPRPLRRPTDQAPHALGQAVQRLHTPTEGLLLLTFVALCFLALLI